MGLASRDCQLEEDRLEEACTLRRRPTSNGSADAIDKA